MMGRGEGPPGTTVVGSIDGVTVYENPDAHYAAVHAASGKTPCEGRAVGGRITVRCRSSEAGRLVLAENAWSGWSVRLDGSRAPLVHAPTLETAAPSGDHVYEFRYRPWDVPFGAGLTLLGLGAMAWLWRADRSARASSSELEGESRALTVNGADGAVG